jgi:hypothetical protein
MCQRFVSNSAADALVGGICIQLRSQPQPVRAPAALSDA